MNIALILAGGVGQRVGADVPKQFLEVEGKPIIVHTLSVFQDCDDIDQIVVVCLDSWEDEIWSYREKYGLMKIVRVIPGGSTGMESIKNGVFGIEDLLSPEDNVVIHDSVRPLISEDIISDCIAVCNRYGNGCASLRMQETVIRTEDGISGRENIDRSNIMRVQTPQAYKYQVLWNLYTEAVEAGIKDSVYTNTLMLELGRSIYFSKGSSMNLKITVAEDIDAFAVMLSYYQSKRKGKRSSS